MEKTSKLIDTILFDDNDYDDMNNDSRNLDWLDLKDNIKYSNQNNECVIIGSLGLWDGRHTIKPVVCATLWEGISKCVNGNYDKQVRIKQTKGYIIISIAHHDGANEFELHLLNAKGKAIRDVNSLNCKHFKKIIGYLF